MPIYEYQCDGCGQIFEVRQKMSDTAPNGHSCGAKSVRRVLSNTSFVLKGTGWYKTDYAQKKPEGPQQSGQQDAQAKAAAQGQKAGEAAAKATPAAEGVKANKAGDGAAGNKPPPSSGGGKGAKGSAAA